MKMSGKAVEELFQFHRPWCGNVQNACIQAKNILVGDSD